MQFDRTTLAIRERGFLDTLDLATHVVRVYAVPLLLTLACGALPLMALNHWLLGWMARDLDSEWDFPIRYLWNLSLQVYLQAPVATLFATKYLGEAVFLERPRWRVVWGEVGKSFGQIALYQLLLRGAAVGCLLAVAIDREGDVDYLWEGVAVAGLACYAWGLRAFRPFLNEIILLEQNPLLAKDHQVVTVSRRSLRLHGANTGDLLIRAVGSSIVGVLLVLACYGTCLFVKGVFLGDWTHSLFLIQFCLPLCMSLVTGYLAVVRFLSYLNLRIREEGWEVELRLKAEARRLRGSVG